MSNKRLSFCLKIFSPLSSFPNSSGRYMFWNFLSLKISRSLSFSGFLGCISSCHGFPSMLNGIFYNRLATLSQRFHRVCGTLILKMLKKFSHCTICAWITCIEKDSIFRFNFLTINGLFIFFCA